MRGHNAINCNMRNRLIRYDLDPDIDHEEIEEILTENPQ
jgi:hypothetical protein